VNNIAWFLRRFPVFAVPGDGRYPVRPVHVDDIAALAVRAARGGEDLEVDAVGPETYAFGELVRRVRNAVGSRALIVPAPPALALLACRCLGALVGDVVLTREEVDGLTAGLLGTDGPATGETRFSAWLDRRAADLGRRYRSEIEIHYRPP
jgi:NADH dehydrogenase